MSEDQIQEELDRHKMMLNVVDEADIEFNSTTWEVLDAETGDMVEWFDEEVRSSGAKVMSCEVMGYLVESGARGDWGGGSNHRW